MNERKHPKSVTVLSILLAVTVFLLALFGILSATVLSRFSVGELLQLAAVKSIIEHNFIFDYDENSLTDGLLSGMVEQLDDPYSVYRTAEEHEAYMYNAMGEFCGVGIVMSLDESEEHTYVLEVYSDSPAEKAGIAEGDEILAVDGEPITADIEETASRVRGTVGSKVTVTFYRSSEESTFDKTFKREELTVETVSTKLLDDQVGYLRISAFNSTTAEETLAAVAELEADGATALILDLRDNSGGSVMAAEVIADYFLDEGVIYSMIPKNGREIAVESDAEQDTVPLCVLVNDGTASASELLCGALHDRGRATVIGETTFGKGIMQNQFSLSGGVLTLTFAEYETPNGTRIHQQGITPDQTVPLSEEDRYRWPILTPESDAQLQAAIQALK